MAPTLHWCFLPGIIISIVSVSSANCALAQITPDATLPNNSVVTPAGNINTITGGTQAGGNLFHSFQEFSIPTGGEAFFNNAVNIQNIISRVTGASASNIDGLIRANGTANFFLLNPNGIIFGPNASLNVGGSFIGTTANAIQFGDRGTFSASTPNAPTPLLTINPSALLFNQIYPTGIINRSQAPAGVNPAGQNITGLRVPDGQSLLLVGGNINIEGGALRAYGGRIGLAGLAAPGTVDLNASGNTFTLSVPNEVTRADISLTNAAEVNVRGANGGDIAINAQNLSLAGESKVRAGIDTGLGTPQSQAGDIVINATGAISLTDGSFIANVPQPNSVGKGGNINITAGSLALFGGSDLNTSLLSQAVGNGGSINIIAGSVSFADGAYLDASTYGQGDAGSVSIQAKDAVTFSFADIYSNVEAGGEGNGGNINISASSLTLKDGAQLQTLLRNADTQNNLLGGRGNAGNVNIDVSGVVNITGQKDGFTSGILSFVGTGAEGKGGDITIKSGSLSISDGATLSASTFGNGNAGSVLIQASDTVSVFNGNIYSFVEEKAVGNGGNIEVRTNDLFVTEGSEINTKTLGQGNAGNITINANEAIALDGRGNEIFSRIISAVNPEGMGNAGNIQITTGSLKLTNGAFISSSTSGKGDAGSITINARDTVSFDSGGGVQSSVFDTGVGKGGDISVTTGSLLLSNGSQISNNVTGKGNAGNITVIARDTVKLDGIVGNAISGIQSSLLTGGKGKGGDIRVTTGSLLVTNGASLSTDTNGQGDAGNITIDARDTITFDSAGNNRFNSNASSTVVSNGVGDGGNIRVTARALFLNNGSQLNASSFGQGNAGKITIDVLDTVAFDGVGSDGLESGAYTLGLGDGGDILVSTGTLSLTNGAKLSTFARGSSGNITINARDAVNFDGVGSNGRPSGAFSLLLPEGVGGKGGDIQITTGTLSVTNGAQLSSSTAGPGNGGNITIDARDVRFDGIGSNGNFSGAYSTVEPTGVGNAGNIKLTANSLSFNNRGILNASTFGKGDAGNISVSVDGAVTLTNSSDIRTTVEAGGVGKAGDIDLRAGSLSVTGGSQIQSLLFRPSGNQPAAQGRGGNIRVTASDSVTLSGRGSTGFSSGLLTSAERETIGNAGNITVNTGQFRVFDGAIVSASSDGTGNAGNITLQASTLTLDNKASISAQTASSQGGNINLQLGRLLLLRRGSQISTSAGTAQAGGDGGNITINTNNGFVVAVPSENSDITANAFTGRGGRVDIRTLGIFGIESRPNPTPLSDITASSERGISGEIAINRPDVDPSQGIVEFPTVLVDTTEIVDTGCAAFAGKEDSEFIVTQRGGLPPRPDDVLSMDVVWSDTRLPNITTQQQAQKKPTAQPRSKTDTVEIVPATGWVFNDKGEVTLISHTSGAGGLVDTQCVNRSGISKK
ncbi:MAG: filamentous hemagglutinin N-terminal domain-containing protein [Scytonema sp. PMC 1069.18]|nr:filamentous hemagglutinin N-terminal domain-containing protein [Scytonema sp. PMC 1069.18]MEC4884958.1 filamentous hemagglutinin N-terminal domain-containing protein [Scytonema sp. PMC 1070.18]